MGLDEKIKALKIERMNLIEKYNGDRSNPSLIKEERRILKEIDKLYESRE